LYDSFEISDFATAADDRSRIADSLAELTARIELATA
jgi:hypothetical protein